MWNEASNGGSLDQLHFQTNTLQKKCPQNAFSIHATRLFFSFVTSGTQDINVLTISNKETRGYLGSSISVPLDRWTSAFHKLYNDWFKFVETHGIHLPTVISARADQKAVITSKSHVRHVSRVTHISLERGLRAKNSTSFITSCRHTSKALRTEQMIWTWNLRHE